MHPNGSALQHPTKLVIENISKTFADGHGGFHSVLTNINMALQDGEFVSLVGPSGCGKSTLLEIVAGLQKPTAGKVLLDGAEPTAPGPDRAVVFQSYALFPWKSVLDNVSFALELAGQSRAERLQTGMTHLKLVGLEGYADRPIHQLSGGMRQRVALARALACRPAVLLMDEPFGALDAITRGLLQEELVKLHHQEQKTVLFVTHSTQEAIRLSNRVVVMGIEPGRIIAEYKVRPVGAQVSEHASGHERELSDEIWDLLRAEIDRANAD
jgi:NitT/TauT family transport system ATP-binding protein